MAKRFPSVVGCAGTLWVRPVIIRSRWASAWPAEREQRRGGLELHDLQGPQDLQLLDVLGQVAAGEPEVDELALRQFRELLDPRLHVVEGGRARAWSMEARSISLLHPLVVADRVGGDGHAQVALGLHDRDPEIPLEADPAGCDQMSFIAAEA